MKSLLMTTIAIFGLALISKGQLPNFVPSNGVVGWWPFNGNADDESGNGNNGITNGPILAIDRFGNSNNSYDFDGIDDFIEVNSNSNLALNTSFTLSAWVNRNSNPGAVITKSRPGPGFGYYLVTNDAVGINNGNPPPESQPNCNKLCEFDNVIENSWYHLVSTWDGFELSLFVNGTLVFSVDGDLECGDTLITSQENLFFGKDNIQSIPIFNGQLDDIGIWNRALTQEEITGLFNAPNCSYNLSITPSTNQLETGSTAIFNATTSDANPSYIWQSDLGQGFQTLNNYGNYSGVNSNSLSISNVQLANHAQSIRVISTSGECIDTSDVATINITDTCIVTINDTITTLISVTDTLVINTLITGLTPPNNSNTIKLFPNPANSHITIDFGNFESMNGYTLIITNSIGQTVYTTPINEQSSYVDLSTWSGNGIYFVQIIDTQNNTIENRKIVLQ